MKLAVESKSSPEAYVLAAVGGFVDSVGILTLGGLFVSHMSGNTAAMGAAFGQGQWAIGALHLFAIPVFVLGLLIGYLAMQSSPTTKRCGIMMLVEFGLLLIFAVSRTQLGAPPLNSAAYFAVVTPPLLAMGLQNALLRELGKTAFASTYVTGVLDMFAKSLAAFLLGNGRKFFGLANRAMGIWFCYVVGALAGSAGLMVFKDVILYVPVVVLFALAVRFLTMKEEA